ncbi:MAG: FkbM family methyltransferase [Nostoc sp.]
MSFPINDKYWVNTAEFLQKNIQVGNSVVAPDEFEEKFTGFISYESIIESSSNDFQWVIIHKGMMDNLEYAFLNKVVNEYNPVFANEVFVIFTKHTSLVALNYNFIHLRKFWEKINLLNNQYAKLKNSLPKDLQNESEKNEVFSNINIKDIALLTRTELELNCRKMSQTVYIGNETILCRVLGKYIFYCDAEDTDIMPHLAINGYWESWITQAMARVLKRGWKCIDIGANHGYYSVLMGDAVGSSGFVIAVEPNPRVARLLKQTIEINGFAKQAIVMQKAIADVDGQAVKLVIPNGKGINGTIVKDAIGSDNVVEVETITLDSLTTDWSNVDFVKIDAEGAEEIIWCGMRETVRKNKNITIIMEVKCSRCLDPKMFIQDIQTSGFKLRHIDYDSQIKSLTVEQCLTERPEEDWMLFLQK